MKTSWETSRNGTPHRLNIGAQTVTMAEGWGHSESGGSCTHQEFLSGYWQNDVAALYGADVLAEVVSNVKAAATYAPFVAQVSRDQALIAGLHAIPVDESLPSLINDPRTMRGSQNYGNAGKGGGTIVRSDSVTLSFSVCDAHITPNDQELPTRSFKLPGPGSSTVAWKDQFCIIVQSNFVLVDKLGHVDAFPSGNQIDLTGAVRLVDCFRHPDTWLFRYMHLADNTTYGLLRYEHGAGFVGRCIED